jgi:hypothetical protein
LYAIYIINYQGYSGLGYRGVHSFVSRETSDKDNFKVKLLPIRTPSLEKIGFITNNKRKENE